MIRTSIITLTHNKLPYTRKCLGSLLETPGRDWELIVVDNGSTDGTREWLDTFRAQGADLGIDIRWIANPASTGCSTARNQGAAMAHGEQLLFMDNDVALRSRHWLRDLGRRLDADPRVAVVGPRLVYPYKPYDIQCAGVGISRSGRVQFRGRGEPRTDPEWNREMNVQALISACFLFRTSAFTALGGFDEAFNPVEYEDLDLCYRARARGWLARYIPEVEMYHFESVTTAGTPTLPNTYLIIKHGLLFKQRWHDQFEKEDGPPDAATQWRPIQPRGLDSIGFLPVMG